LLDGIYNYWHNRSSNPIASKGIAMLRTDDIKAELTRRRIFAKDIARELGLALSTVTRAINGDTRNPDPRIFAFIARLLGVAEYELQPGPPLIGSNHNFNPPNKTMSNFQQDQPHMAIKGRD
jgi:transcriptional regulator with XRE-family HTH domain